MRFSRSGAIISGTGILLLVLMAVFTFNILNPGVGLVAAMLQMFVVGIQGTLVALAVFLILIGILINVL